MVRRKDPGPQSKLRKIDIVGAHPAKMPGYIAPQLATLRVNPTSSDKYLHEIKFDGYRIQAHLNAGYATLYSRKGLDWTGKFESVATGVSGIAGERAIIDGEIISAEANGRANFSQLQDDISKRRFDRMVYYVFDLLYLDGYDLRGAALVERKRLLQDVLTRSRDITPVQFSEHFEVSGAELFKQACDLGLEGIISKRKDRPYRTGERTDDWLKAKCLQVGRYEVVGYKDSASSLYLGKREGDKFLYAGKAGTGYTNKMIADLYKLMKPITTTTRPLTRKPNRKKIDHWVEPKYWAEVEYRDITSDGLLRHVTFRGLYTSKAATKAVVSKFT